MAIIYRSTGAWGTGQGSALSFSQVDGNWYYLLSNMSGSIISITGSASILGSLSVLPEGTINQLTSSWAISSSHAVTASYAANATVSDVVRTNLGDATTQVVEGGLTLTGDLTAEQYIISSSVVHYTESFASGSHIFGDDSLDTHQFTGSILLSGSITATPVVINDLTASYAITASHALNAGGGGIFSQTGSYQATTNNLQITGSIVQTNPGNTNFIANPDRGNVAFGKLNTVGGGWLGFVHGIGNTVSKSFGHAEGSGSYADGVASHAEGYWTLTTAKGAHSEGKYTTASGDYSHAEGDSTVVEATCSYGHAEGIGTIVRWDGAHAEGWGTLAKGYASHAEGQRTTSSANYCHAEGSGSEADGVASHAEGFNTYTNANYAHAEGQATSASGVASHAEGNETLSSGDYSHAQGWKTTSSGDYSLSSGVATHASGAYSTAMGYGSIAKGDNSFAGGYFTKAIGGSSHAIGNYTTASNHQSFAAGNRTYTQFKYQSVTGQYNESGSSSGNYTSSFQIGSGYEDAGGVARYSSFEASHISRWDGFAWNIIPFITIPNQVISPTAFGGSNGRIDATSPDSANQFDTLSNIVPTGSFYLSPGNNTLWAYTGRNNGPAVGTISTPEGWTSYGGGYVETAVTISALGTKTVTHNLGTEHVIVQFVEGGATSGNFQCTGRAANTITVQSVGGATCDILIKVV